MWRHRKKGKQPDHRLEACASSLQHRPPRRRATQHLRRRALRITGAKHFDDNELRGPPFRLCLPPQPGGQLDLPQEPIHRKTQPRRVLRSLRRLHLLGVGAQSGHKRRSPSCWPSLAAKPLRASRRSAQQLFGLNPFGGIPPFRLRGGTH